MLNSIITRARLLTLLLLALGTGQPMLADAARIATEDSIQIVVNPVTGSPRIACEASAANDAGKQEWWITVRLAKVGGVRIECGVGTAGPAAADSDPSATKPYIKAAMSTFAGLLPRGLKPEPVLVRNVSLSVEKRSDSDSCGNPDYRRDDIQRKLYVLDRREAFVPLLVANDAEEKAFGIREVLICVVAGVVDAEVDAEVGDLWVISGPSGAELLLDGSVAGTIPEDGETILRNVPVGERLLGLRDSSGQWVHSWARVHAQRTVVTDLSLPRPARLAARSIRLIPLGRNAWDAAEYRRTTDGAVVVKIPAGEFLMGNEATELSPPEHRVYVSDFLFDKTGVTWGQYKKFAAQTGTPLPPHEPYWGIQDDHPAVYVTWEEAKAYCEWAGGRLPTEAEREKAARGTDERMYPWGEEEPDSERGVFRRSWGSEATAAVGTHPAGASPYGILDAGGNVWEWCADWYDRDYYSVSPSRDPRGPSSGTARVARGGSWDSRPTVLSSSCRNWGYRGYREGDFGFRCAMNVPE